MLLHGYDESSTTQDRCTLLLYSWCACVQAIPAKRWDDLTSEATPSTFTAAPRTISTGLSSQPQPVSEPTTRTKPSTNAEVIFVALPQRAGICVLTKHQRFAILLCSFVCLSVCSCYVFVQTIMPKRWDDLATEATSSTSSSADSHATSKITFPRPKHVSKPTTRITVTPKPSTNAEVMFVALLIICCVLHQRGTVYFARLFVFQSPSVAFLCRRYRYNIGITLQQTRHHRSPVSSPVCKISKTVLTVEMQVESDYPNTRVDQIRIIRFMGHTRLLLQSVRGFYQKFSDVLCLSIIICLRRVEDKL